MTERDWLKCDDPATLLDFLGANLSERKLRLYVCACCRRLGTHLRDERSQRAVDVAERYAEGACSGEDLASARTDAEKAAWSGLGTSVGIALSGRTRPHAIV